MNGFRWAVVALACGLLAAPLAAEEGADTDRWQSVFNKGEKVGWTHTETVFPDEGGDGLRSVAFNGRILVHGTTTVFRGGKRKANPWTFELNAKWEADFENGKVVRLKAKRGGTEVLPLKASSKVEDGVLVVKRKSGVKKETLRIAPSDYDVTTDHADMERFLAAIQDARRARVFVLGDAEVRLQTFQRKADGVARDVDGIEKPCRVYRTNDEDGRTTFKTIDGRIVYVWHKEKGYPSGLTYYLTTKDQAR